MLKITDLVYYNHNEYNQPQQVLDRHKPSLGFIDHIKDKVSYEVVRHMNYEGQEMLNEVPYHFFKRSNASWQIPFKTHRYIKRSSPDVVLVHGFIFPLQVIALRFTLGKKPKIILQHQGDQPAPSIRSFFQKIADRFVDAYIVTAKEITEPWLQQKIIKDRKKIYEVLEASVDMPVLDKTTCKSKLGLSGTSNFLWVGRLDKNKDPLTVINSFSKYILSNPAAKLYMIYQTEDLLNEVKQAITANRLEANIILIGKLPHHELATWYHAADLFISASHYEGSGYALLEAMHCGCIPVVTGIPSFNKITRGGKYGFLYTAGDEKQLLSVLNDIQDIDKKEFSKKVLTHAKNELGFKNIAADIFSICTKLVAVK